MKNIFEKQVTEEMVKRVNSLHAGTHPQWGKMSVGQMLAHCSVIYEMVYDQKHRKPNAFLRFILKTFVKNAVVSEKPYKQNGQTAPQFLIKEDKDFAREKDRLIEYLLKTQQLGENHFHQKESLSFGVLSSTEWNNMFYKHLDHHLKQFGV